MDAKEYEIMHRAEDSHWWYRGMATITRAVIDLYYSHDSNLRILDAGTGTGSGMALLSEYGNVTGFDISPQAISYSKKRYPRRLAMGSIMEVPFLDRTFDLVTSFDVLYFDHVHDDLALQEISRVLVRGGRVILRVPAFDWLRGVHDIKVSTGHRYTLPELSKKMKNNGLYPGFMSYANSVLFPIILVKRLCERCLPRQSDSDLAVNMGFIDKFFEYCLRLEARIIKMRPLPFGLSIFAVGQKSFKKRNRFIQKPLRNNQNE